MCECAEGARSVRSGAAFLPRCSRDMKTLGHVHSSSLRLRLASHHLAVSFRLIGQTKTHPLARRLAAGLAVRLAPHTMLRIVFVAVDRTHVARSVTHSHNASGARTRC